MTSRRIPSIRPPNTSVLDPSTETVVTATTAKPDVTSRARLFSRIRSGLGRLLRGTDHTTFMAFWMAWPRPIAP